MARGISPNPSRPASTANRPNGRKGSRKVRTGCVTCKIRKVKCDEAKPACIRCTSSGRPCDGYPPAKRAKQLPNRGAATNDDDNDDELALVAELSSLPEFGSAEEQRTFHFFRRFTGPKLAADLDSGFWTALVLRLCHSEPAVRHGVLAVSSFHQSLVLGERDACDELVGKQVFALQQYNKAISIVRGRISDVAVDEPLVPLLMCLLFICMEFMQGKEIESLNYLQQGRKMMHQFVENQQIPSSQLDLIRQHVVPIYLRSGLTSFLFGANVVPIPAALDAFCEVPPVFSSIEEARNTFYSIADRVLRSAFVARQTKYSPSTPPEIAHALNMEQQALMSILTKWNAAFSLFTISRTDGSPPQPSALVMQLYFHAAVIWVSTTLTQRETDFDKHTHSFSAMLMLAKAFLEATDKKAPKSRRTQQRSSADNKASMPASGYNDNDMSDIVSKLAFAFETHVIPPLYFISTKCRHPLIRRAALDLLERHTDRQENLWRAKCMARVAARFIEIETNISVENRLHMAATYPSRPTNSTADASSPYFGQGEFSADTQPTNPSLYATTFENKHGRVLPVSLFRNSNHGMEETKQAPTRGSCHNLSGYGRFSTHDHPVENIDIDWDVSGLDPALLNVPVRTHFEGSSNQPVAPASSAPAVETTTFSPTALDWSLTFGSPDVGIICDGLQRPNYVPGTTLRNSQDHTLPIRSPGSKPASTIPTDAAGGDRGVFSHESLDAPYDLPEGMRLSDAVIGPLDSDGRWTTFFRKPKAVGGKWDIWEEYIFTA